MQFRTRFVRSRSVDWVCVCFTLVGIMGCGGADPGPPRFPISGTVNYNGAPVPHGEIIFEPDAEAGNNGPATRAVIDNGAYSTKKGPGFVGGPMIVRITGTDGEAGTGTQPHGAPLFKEYTEKVELPKAETTQDFEVPAK